MIDYEKELNGPQLEAVRTVDGPVLILAGAGSGKTRVLTYRTAYLINEMNVRPWNIMALTFTNKAAGEMKQRINDMTGYDSGGVWVSTFHSTCLKILFIHAEKLGYQPGFEIADASDQKRLMKDVFKKLNVDTRMYKEKTLMNLISSAKDELMGPEDFAMDNAGDFRMKTCVDVYFAYQEQLKRNNAMDFDDLIMNTVRLFKEFPDVLESYQEKFRYICVDEYQDTNLAQFELVRLLASKYRNLCVVGDDDQSIYKFRGANIRNILDFEKIYKDAKVIKLEQNYRSTSNILDAANSVISNNRGRKVKKLWTKSGTGKKIRFKQLDSASGEAAYIADDIRTRVKEDCSSYNDFAILLRTNVQSKEFEDAFRVRGINYELVKGLRFWDRKVIKDVTAYLLTALSGLNDMRTSRIINIPKRGVGQASLDKLMLYSIENDMSLLDACGDCEEAGIRGKTVGVLKDFYESMKELKRKSEGMRLSGFTDLVLKETGYLYYLDEEADTPEEYNEMIEYIDKLKESLDEYEDNTENPDIIDFMRINGVEGNNVDSAFDEDDKDRVKIMTMHNAKGLEFDNVYMAGMEDGLFPGFMAVTSDDPLEIEEERRLCYVAITRARKDLTMTCARMRMSRGQVQMQSPSRFIKEIPIGLLDMNIRVEEKKPPVAGQADREPFKKKWSGVKLKLGSQMEIKEPDYKAGDRVRSFKWGEGTVLSITRGERDYEVEVDFDGTGVRKVFAGFAKLKRV